MKGFSTFVISLLALAIALSVFQLKTLKGAVADEKDGRGSQLFGFDFASIASFIQALVSAFVSLPQFVVGLITNFFNGIFLPPTTATTTTTTTSTTAAPATTSDIASSPLPTTSRMASTVTITTTVPTSSTSASAAAATTAASSPGPIATVPTTSTSMAAASTASSAATSSTTTMTTGTTTTTTTTPAPDLRKVVFVTNDTFTGNLGGVAGADEKCSSAAQSANLNGIFLPWISNVTVSPSSRFTKSETPYILVNGMTIAANYSDLVANGPQLPINITEFGDSLPIGSVWTGTGTAGDVLFAEEQRCGEWMDTTLEGVIGAHGTNKDFSPSFWTFLIIGRCTGLYRLYCFQQ